MKRFTVFFILIFSFYHLIAQDYTEFYLQSNNMNNKAMLVLGSWASANLVSGAIGWRNSSSSQKYFHQMNFMWNTVNLGIAGFALYNNLNFDISSLSNSELMDKHLSTEKLYLINAALDIGYIGGGILMWRFSEKSKKAELLKGYGQSVILQGSFLLVFDLIIYGIQRNHRLDFIENLNISSDGLGLFLSF